MADNTSADSQQVLKLWPLLDKPASNEPDMEQFQANIIKNRNDVQELLNKRRVQTEEANTQHRHKVAALLYEALRPTNLSTRSKVVCYTGTNITKNSMDTMGKKAINACSSLIAEYGRLNNKVKELQDADERTAIAIWEQEINNTEEHFKLGARVALRRAKKMLGAELHGGLNDRVEEEETTTEEETPDLELHKNLTYAERGVRRMVKGLPIDENEA